MEKISKYVSLAEATKSQQATRKGINNVPNKKQVENMQAVAMNVFDKIRLNFGIPIAISSFFRCEELNTLIGGAPNSQHCTGEAIDIDADILGGIENKHIFMFIFSNLDFDQLIWEYGDKDNPDWVHVSFSRTENRKNVLQAVRNSKGKTTYKKFV